jgi:ferredoxin--NADP+ reductase
LFLEKIIEKAKLAPNIHRIRFHLPLLVEKAQPGQFVILRIDESGERIPMSIADLDKKNGILTIVFQEVGKSTAQLGSLKEGDSLADVVGPLGTPTHIEKYGNCVCVGGGIGIAPIHPVAKALRETGNYVTSIIGVRNKELLIMEEESKASCDNLIISTDDGSYGFHGFVTQVLAGMLEKGEKVDFVFSVGPVLMMRALARVTLPYKVRTIISLNPIMVDGTGMCGACRVTVGNQTKFACVDGPDFDAHLVDFEELLKRQRMYLKQEKVAMDNFVSSREQSAHHH